VDDLARVIDQQRNPHFTTERVVGLFEGALRVTSLASFHEDFSLSTADLDELRRARELTLSRTTAVFDSLINMTEARRRNLVEYRHLNFVSLGLDCMARTFPTRWGLKPPAKLGEQSGPFDLAIHLPNVVGELLDSGFADYLKPDDLEFNPTLNYCVNRRLGISFNHEVGEEYREDNFRKLRDTYEARVARLPSMLSDPRPLVLVVSYPHFFGAHSMAVQGLQRIHQRISEARTASTIMFCFRVHAPSVRPEVADFCSDRFTWANFPMPSDDYVWHDPTFFLTDAGMRFEQRIIAALEDTITREGLRADTATSTA